MYGQKWKGAQRGLDRVAMGSQGTGLAYILKDLGGSKESSWGPSYTPGTHAKQVVIPNVSEDIRPGPSSGQVAGVEWG